LDVSKFGGKKYFFLAETDTFGGPDNKLGIFLMAFAVVLALVIAGFSVAYVR